MTNAQQITTSKAENRKGGIMNETIVWPTKTRELHNHLRLGYKRQNGGLSSASAPC
jgi:hypothetical protein